MSRMGIGGVEKALIAMLNALEGRGLQVHLALITDRGEMFRAIPAWVHVHIIKPLNRHMRLLADPKRTLAHDFMRLRWRTLPYLLPYIHKKLHKEDWKIARRMLRHDDALGMEFDLAINYTSPYSILDYYVARHVRARKRAAWVHFDLSRWDTNPNDIRRLHPLMDRIFIVAEHARECYCRLYPETAHKTVTFRNLVDPRSIAAEAEQPSDYRPGRGTNFVIVGRVSAEKGQDLAIRAFAGFLGGGAEGTLHIVGDGPLMDTCRALAAELCPADSVRFYGSQINPYPFMRGADVFVQPSLQDAFSISLAEACLFGMPIVATEVSGAHEMLDSRPNAIICSDFTPETMTDALRRAATMPHIEPDTRQDVDFSALFDLLPPLK